MKTKKYQKYRLRKYVSSELRMNVKGTNLENFYHKMFNDGSKTLPLEFAQAEYFYSDFRYSNALLHQKRANFIF
jgi:hypothetical protein